MTDPFTIRQAIDAQLELHDWWKLPIAQTFGEGFIAALEAERAGGGGLVKYPDGRGVPENFSRIESETLLECEPFLIAKSMVELFEQASKTFPGDELNHHELPVDDGFMYLERPVWVEDRRGKMMNVRAIAWRHWDRIAVHSEETGENVPTGGCLFTVYSDRDTVEKPDGTTPNESEQDYLRGSFPALVLLHVAPMAYARYTFVGPKGKGESFLPLMRAAWAIMQQPLAMRTGAALPRPLRRDLARRGITLPTLNVVTLRKRLQSPPTGNEVDVEWSHRWMVRGHWRRLWDEKTGVIKYTWIREHIKGPDDRPLIIKDRAFRVSR